MSKKNVLVIFGGKSNEYEISLESVSCLLKNIDKDKYNIYTVGINSNGEFLYYTGNVENIENDTWQQLNNEQVIIGKYGNKKGIIRLNDVLEVINIDVVFPVLHGKNGEDGTLQGLLEINQLPYVGCNVISSAICMDKLLSHIIAESLGINIAKNVVLNNEEMLKDVEDIIKKLKLPVYIKPIKSGSSIGITKANNKIEILAGIKEAFKYDNKVIIEEEIIGDEIGVAILGNKELIIGQLDQIILTTDYFDFHEKYTLEKTLINLPAKISENKAEEIKNIAKEIYKLLECKGLARVDMFLKKNGEIVFNEINTMPGFTNKSRFPSMMNKINLSYTDIIDKLIYLALEEKKYE